MGGRGEVAARVVLKFTKSALRYRQKERMKNEDGARERGDQYSKERRSERKRSFENYQTSGSVRPRDNLLNVIRRHENLINLSGPGVTVCPLVQVPLSGVGSAESIRDMANLDSWILSAKLPRNIVLSESREKLWASLCSSASAFLDQSPPCSVLYLPISLNNKRKKRFSAGPLAGEFPAECDTESAIISSITGEQ